MFANVVLCFRHRDVPAVLDAVGHPPRDPRTAARGRRRGHPAVRHFAGRRRRVGQRLGLRLLDGRWLRRHRHRQVGRVGGGGEASLGYSRSVTAKYFMVIYIYFILVHVVMSLNKSFKSQIYEYLIINQI